MVNNYDDERKYLNLSIDDLLEVEIDSPNTQDVFLQIKETLTRIGMMSKPNIIIQSCHILQKQGRYFIVHFKELFALDGRKVNFTSTDKQIRNKIASLLDDWGLLTIKQPNRFKLSNDVRIKGLRIVPYKEVHVEDKWVLDSRYSIGKYSKKDKR